MCLVLQQPLAPGQPAEWRLREGARVVANGTVVLSPPTPTSSPSSLSSLLLSSSPSSSSLSSSSSSSSWGGGDWIQLRLDLSGATATPYVSLLLLLLHPHR